jgi:hypothetical protein
MSLISSSIVADISDAEVRVNWALSLMSLMSPMNGNIRRKPSADTAADYSQLLSRKISDIGDISDKLSLVAQLPELTLSLIPRAISDTSRDVAWAVLPASAPVDGQESRSRPSHLANPNPELCP